MGELEETETILLERCVKKRLRTFIRKEMAE
jgi:hypothetical protein